MACMPDRSRNRPRDLNALAASIVRDATDEDEVEQQDDGKGTPAAVARAGRGGSKGGEATAVELASEQR
jgi:hypothetical protein